jgi:hypothetical protein
VARADQMQLGGGPSLRKQPRDIRWALDIEASVHQHGGDVGQLMQITEQLVII